MKITECYIENFGRLSDKKYVFSDGLNKILADNGEGKTTLSVFIKCMLYGMSDTKKASLDENERKRYLPWSGAAAGGSLSFKIGEKSYRIERSFAPKASEDTFKLYDTTLGRECTEFTEAIGEELFGVDADSFERTLFLSERALAPKNSNKSISAKLSELVGCDGDISSMDAALKLLEEQRRAYAKKGGSGEIADTKEKISRILEELEGIDRAESRIKETENALSALTQKEMRLREEETGINREREALAKKNSSEVYKKTVSDMKTRLALSEDRRGELIAFFNGKIPSSAEVERAKMQENEARRLREETKNEESEEYKRLKARFTDRADPEEIKKVKEAYDRIRLGAYDETDEEKRRRALFKKRTPTKEEVQREIADIKANIKKPWAPTLFIIIGILTALLGIALGAFVSPVFSFIIFIGVIIIALIPLINSHKHKSYMKRLRASLASISNEAAADTRDPLLIFEEMSELLCAADIGICREERDDRELLSRFALLFGMGDNLLIDISEIIGSYERYRELEAVERYKAERRLVSARELQKIKESLAEFISGFSYTTDNPIEEAYAALSEYTMLSNEIIERQRDITNLTTNHKTEEFTEAPIRSTAELDLKSGELNSLFSEISRERALLDRQHRADCELIECREELLSKKEELEERLGRYSENLEIIKLTKKYLEEARENMTTKYLGKTRAAFEKYVGLIGNERGEYFMDTNFAVTKLEGAKAHSTEAYSRGMRDLYDLAARFALIDSLYEREEPFVILDDPFCTLDDKKCKAAIAVLEDFSREKQIIYFTCSASRA